MSPDELHKTLSAVVSGVGSKLKAKAPELQEELYDLMVELSAKLSINSSGSIKGTAENFNALRDASKQIQRVLDTPEYQEAVSDVLQSISIAESSMAGYFSDTFSNFKARANVVQQVKRASIQATVDSLSASGVSAMLNEGIQEVLRQNITAGGTLKDLRGTLRQTVMGGADDLGALEQYFGQVTFDAVQQYNRNYMRAVTRDLDLEWFLYEGSRKATSRKFCVRRAGNYYHKEEIQAWAKRRWSGKAKGTNQKTIFTYAGGYRCRHHIIPVDPLVVPDSVINRNLRKGNISKEERDRLLERKA